MGISPIQNGTPSLPILQEIVEAILGDVSEEFQCVGGGENVPPTKRRLLPLWKRDGQAARGLK